MLLDEYMLLVIETKFYNETEEKLQEMLDRHLKMGEWSLVMHDFRMQELRDRSLFIAGGAEDFGGITWFLGEQKGGSVVTGNPKGGIAENFGRIQRGNHSNLLGKWSRGDRESHQML